MNKEISEKIAEIIEAANKRKWVNYELQLDHSLSQDYPEGESAYFKRKIFELKKDIADQTMIGLHWIENYCKPDIFNSDWMQTHTEIFLKHADKKEEVWNQLKIFIDQRIQLGNYEAFVKESEPGPGNKEPIIGKEYLTFIYNKYRAYINEDLTPWVNRFIYPNGPAVNKIEIETKALSGSKRLVLLAILASIQDNRKESFDYNDFVFDRFGIKNFDKARHDHKDKPEFDKTFAECNAILRK